MPVSPRAPAAVTSRSIVAILSLLASGCAGSPWQRDVTYSSSGVAMYREWQEKDGARVALGNAHPYDLTVEKAVLILSQLVYREEFLLKKSRSSYVFVPEEIRSLALPLTVGLATLRPDERLRFLVARSNWTDVVLGRTTGTSAVVFATHDGTLHFVFDRISDAVTGGDDGDPAAIRFRTEPTEVVDGSPLLPGGGTRLHVDPSTGTKHPRWLEVRVEEVKPLAPPPAPPPPAAVPAPGPETIVVPERPPLEPVKTPPASPPATTPAPPPTAVLAPGPAPAEDERYRRVRERVETLQRLRAEGVLPEEEYRLQLEKALSGS